MRLLVRPVGREVVGMRAAASGLGASSGAVLLLMMSVCWLWDAGAAAARDWTVQTPPAVPGLTGGHLAAVSCATASDCMAVGRYVDAAGVSLTLAERFARGRWSLQRTPNPSGTSGAWLLGVSCPSAKLCVAVGASTGRGHGRRVLIERWDGRRWRLAAVGIPGAASASLAGVACPGPAGCVAVGSDSGRSGVARALVERWDGVRWTVQRTPRMAGRRASLAAVSCASATMCMAVGRDTWPGHWTTLSEVWHASRWRIVPAPDPPDSGPLRGQPLSGVSCPTPRDCTAVGTYEVDYNVGHLSFAVAERFNGTRWIDESIPMPTRAESISLAAVSCAARGVCVATGSDEARRIRGRWVIQNRANGSQGGALEGVSCPSQATCIAVGAFSNHAGVTQTLAERWSSGVWALEPTPNPTTGASASTLTDVSCVSTGACTAVGSYTNTAGDQVALIERWNGTAWSLQQFGVPVGAVTSQLTGISCSSATECVAVGDYTTAAGAQLGVIAGWRAGRWMIQSAGGAVMTAVSCPATGACMAVGPQQSESWDGTGWTTQSMPILPGWWWQAPGTGAREISCTSPSFCMAVGSRQSSTLADAWNGTSWSLQSTPNATQNYYYDGSDWLSDVSCPGADSCTAVGGWADYHIGGAIAEPWRGHEWTLQNLDPSPGTGGSLSGVSCPSTTDCTAVGGAGVSAYTPLAKAWDGTTWTIENPPSPSGAYSAQLASVACSSPTACTAVGSYTTTDAGLSTQLIEHT